MNTDQPIARNVRIVTCDGYCEEIEILEPKHTLPEAVANHDAQIRHDLE